jgi:hypothetical protein
MQPVAEEQLSVALIDLAHRHGGNTAAVLNRVAFRQEPEAFGADESVQAIVERLIA